MTDLLIRLDIPSQNQTERGRNHYVRAAITKERRRNWYYHCAGSMRSHGVTKATSPRRLHVVSYRKRLCFDIANLIGGAKACVDGMVDAGLLVDDRDTKAMITYEQKLASVSPAGRGVVCTILQIEDATP